MREFSSAGFVPSTHALWYEGQLLEAAGDKVAAYTKYAEYVAAQDADPALSFPAMVQLADLAQELSMPWDTTSFLWLQRAVTLSVLRFAAPRAEPLYRLAEHYYSSQPHVAFYYLQQACDAPEPWWMFNGHGHWVEWDVYKFWRWRLMEHLAFRVEQIPVAIHATEKAIAARNEDVDIENLRFFQQRVEQLKEACEAQPQVSLTPGPSVSSSALPSLRSVSAEVWIISLQRQVHKYQQIAQHLKDEIDVDASHWVAVDSKLISRSELDDMGIIDVSMKRSSCAASHLSLWENLQEGGDPLDWITIFEDDALLHERFAEHFAEAWQTLPSDAQLIFLGHMPFISPEFSLSYPKVAGTNGSWRSGAPLCLHGYMLRRGFAGVLARNLRRRPYPIDIAVIRWIRETQCRGQKEGIK
jgi:hypothetical protein